MNRGANHQTKKSRQRSRPKKQQKKKPHTVEIARGVPVAAEHRCVLTYVSTAPLFSATATTAAALFKVNSAYDFDNSFGTTAIPFYAELSTIYNYYRVIGVKFTVTVVNRETFPLGAYIIMTNTMPATSGTGYYLRSGQPFGQGRVLPGTAGMNKGIFHASHTIEAIVGTPAPKYEDNFRATINTDPADLVWMAIGIDSHTASLPTNGVMYQIRAHIDVKFYGRTNLASFDIRKDQIRRVEDDRKS